MKKKLIEICEGCGERKWLALKKINGIEKALCKNCFEEEMRKNYLKKFDGLKKEIDDVSKQFMFPDGKPMEIIVFAFQEFGKPIKIPVKMRFCCWETLYEYLETGGSLYKCDKCLKRLALNAQRKR